MTKNFHLIFMILVVFLITSCNKDENTTPDSISDPTSSFDSDIITNWIDVYLHVEKDLAGFRPATTARALSYINMAAYHTANPGMPDSKNLSEIIPAAKLPVFEGGTNEYHWPSAVNAAYKSMYNHFLFNKTQAQQNLINETFLLWNEKYISEVGEEIVNRSEAWGNLVASKMIEFAVTDLAAEAQITNPVPNNYNPPVGFGLWVGSDGPALFPYWGQVRTFGTFNFDAMLVDPIPASSDPSSEFYKQADEVNTVITNLSNKDRWVAEFWSDDIVGLTFSPAARQFAILEQYIIREDMDMAKTLLISVKLGMSMNDAAVICWYAKYKYNVIRPENFIREFINPDFKTILGEAIGVSDISPSFPAYPSGHSTFASASSGILVQELGEGISFTDSCHVNRSEFIGTPRTYISWKTMAEENAYSRIPLGVHYRMDCDEGLRVGYIVSDNINKLFDQ